ncbi:MAG: 50S ribosomal protein L9 [Phycisphaeraceae bacterium]|nr:50S ribosomal protein L9 [Phycisphaeraceae bacterium]
MARDITLLLLENVDNLGIVGDVVKVRAGYARNFLLPRELATAPDKELIAQLAARRAVAEKEVAATRSKREEMAKKLDGQEITMVRACNDQGVLYGAVTQQDVSKALQTLGFDVKPREVRLPFAIKRIDSYDVLLKFASDLESHIRVFVEPDRTIEADDREEMEFDNEGNLIEPGGKKGGRRAKGEQQTPATEATQPQA